jgi:hypothetical protein
MSIISPEKFIEWCKNHEDQFGQIIVHGNEVKLNSIFKADDTDHKLWCNPCGGKKNRDGGVFHCWKTGEKGSLIKLICIVDNCSFEEAREILGGENLILRNLEAKLKEFLENKYSKPKEEESANLSLPPYTSLISELPTYNFHRVQAEVYLFNRKIPTDGMYICTGGGRYRQRIIIPYFGKDGNLIYFNARYIGPLINVPKYLASPKSEKLPGKDDVIFMIKWPPVGSKIYLTEGEFNALSIYYSSKKTLNAGAFGGKNLSDKQVEMIRHYQVVLCLDTDKAGKDGLTKMAVKLRSKGLMPWFVRAPKIFNDWNSMLQKVGPDALIDYLLKHEKPLDDAALMRLMT